MSIGYIILCIFIPPLAVFLKLGISAHFFLNLLATICGFYVCGMIHAFYVVSKKIKRDRGISFREDTKS